MSSVFGRDPNPARSVWRIGITKTKRRGHKYTGDTLPLAGENFYIDLADEQIVRPQRLAIALLFHFWQQFDG